MTTNRFNGIHSATIRAGIDRLVNTVAACQGTLDHQAIIAGLNSVGNAVQAECQRVLRERRFRELEDAMRKELAKLGTDPYRTPEQKQREADIDRELEDQYGDDE